MAPIPPDMDDEELARLREQTEEVQRKIKFYKEALGEELGNFQTQVLETGRVLMIPEGVTEQEEWLVCYLVDGRLIIDDYVPELADDIDPNPVPIEP